MRIEPWTLRFFLARHTTKPMLPLLRNRVFPVSQALAALLGNAAPQNTIPAISVLHNIARLPGPSRNLDSRVRLMFLQNRAVVIPLLAFGLVSTADPKL